MGTEMSKPGHVGGAGFSIKGFSAMARDSVNLSPCLPSTHSALLPVKWNDRGFDSPASRAGKTPFHRPPSICGSRAG